MVVVVFVLSGRGGKKIDETGYIHMFCEQNPKLIIFVFSSWIYTTYSFVFNQILIFCPDKSILSPPPWGSISVIICTHF